MRICWRGRRIISGLGRRIRGPNTGGMGAYSPAPLLTDELLTRVQRETIVPLMDTLPGGMRLITGGFSIRG